MAYTGPLGRAFLRRGGPGYESDWYGDAIVNSVADAARSAITEVVRGIAEDIRNEHPNWDHKTHQLHDAVFSKPAIIEWSTHQPGAPTSGARPASSTPPAGAPPRRTRRPRTGPAIPTPASSGCSPTWTWRCSSSSAPPAWSRRRPGSTTPGTATWSSCRR